MFVYTFWHKNLTKKCCILIGSYCIFLWEKWLCVHSLSYLAAVTYYKGQPYITLFTQLWIMSNYDWFVSYIGWWSVSVFWYLKWCVENVEMQKMRGKGKHKGYSFARKSHESAWTIFNQFLLCKIFSKIYCHCLL